MEAIMHKRVFCKCGAWLDIIASPPMVEEKVRSFLEEHSGKGHGEVSEKECNERRRGDCRVT